MSQPPPPTAAAPEDTLDVDALASLFAALADPSRLTLLANLACRREPATVTEASSCCGVHLSGVSRHLAVLRRAGVVEADRHGREVRYRLRRRQLGTTLRALAAWIDPAGAAVDASQALGCCGGSATPRPTQACPPAPPLAAAKELP